jgi:MFS family permease
MFIGGIWVGRIYDNYGPHYLLAFGTFFHVFGLMMASISTEYYQFILSQSVCSALGASMIFYPSMSAIVTWFFKRRAMALGVTAAGSSLGGVLFPIMVEKLVPEVGFGWTMRICAFLILFLMIIANLTITSRIPPHPRPVKIMDFISPLAELKFAVMSIGMFAFFLGLFLPFTFVILEGQDRGVPNHIAIYLVSILNAASIFGRTIPGYAADKLGRFTVFVSMAFLTSIITLALWIPGYGTAAVVIFAVIFGFSSGCIVSLAPTLIAHLSDVTKIGTRTGTMFSIVAIAVLIGSPIGGQLIIADNGGYVKMQIFSGVLMIVGSVFFLVLRVLVGGWSLGKKV